MNSLVSRVAALTLLALAGVGLLMQIDSDPGRESLAVQDLLGDGDGAEEGYRRADPAYRITLPEDHGAHPDYRSEWWYFTGNLASADGRRFGFQLTFFRFALAAVAPRRDSAWGARQVWMAHFALTDVHNRRFHRDERYARGALGLAGAEIAPFRVWLEDWAAHAEGETMFPLRLVARADGYAIDLALSAGRPAILQGRDGYSAKGPEPGNASHYYSYTRMPATGSIRLDGQRIPVSGHGWLDREWSTSALGPDVDGWDWFALQLDDGRDLMVYRLRRRDGSSTPFSAGTLVSADGRIQRLAVTDFVLQPGSRWRSPTSGAEYPVYWRLAIPKERLTLEIEPLLEAQEMDLSVRYWEGAVRASGEHAGEPLAGHGYLEMTGYEP